MSESRVLKARCGKCGCKIQVKTHSDRKVVACPKCNTPVTVTATSDVTDTAPQPATADVASKVQVFPCPNCGSEVATSQKSIGKSVRCRECEQRVRVPDAVPVRAGDQQPARRPVKQLVAGFALVLFGVSISAIAYLYYQKIQSRFEAQSAEVGAALTEGANLQKLVDLKERFERDPDIVSQSDVKRATWVFRIALAVGFVCGIVGCVVALPSGNAGRTRRCT